MVEHRHLEAVRADQQIGPVPWRSGWDRFAMV